MMKKKFRYISMVLYLSISIVAFGWMTKPVYSATCTWTGAVDNNWHNASNWSGSVLPGSTDDVVIPNVTNDPVIYSGTWGTAINSIEIQSGAQLILQGYSELSANTWDNYGTLQVDFDNSHPTVNIKGSTSWPYSGTFNNHTSGVIITSNVEYYYDLHVYTTLNNDGLVDLNGTFSESHHQGSIILRQDGSHDGTFSGESGTDLVVGWNESPGKTNDFNGYVSTPNMTIQNNAIVNFSGQYAPASTDTTLYIFEGSELNFMESAPPPWMPELVSISGTLSLPDATEEIDFYELNLYSNGEIINEGGNYIADEFSFHGGTLSGGGNTYVKDTVTTFNLLFGSMTIDQQILTNSASAYWRSGTIGLINGAAFENYGTFEANDNSTMNGDATSSFHNNPNSDIQKTRSGSTTTMNIDFTNEGTIEVIEGTLIFTGDVTAGDGTEIDLDEEQFQGNTLILEEGSILKGSGTVDGDLENSGDVCPGDSPGNISVTGDFTQYSSGTLYIELGGTTPGTEYDQLTVTGSATLAGTLDVSLINSFTPDYGQTFTIMTYASKSGTFDTVNLPALSGGLEWTLEYGDTALTIYTPPPPPEVSLSSATYSVGESDGTVTITVILNTVLETAVTVDYSTSNGTATAGSDYTTTSSTCTFVPGDTNEAFTVPIISDSIYEGDEYFNITLSNPSGAALGTPSSAQVTITDDDPELEFIFLPLVMH
jgi:hypothetical protein